MSPSARLPLLRVGDLTEQLIMRPGQLGGLFRDNDNPELACGTEQVIEGGMRNRAASLSGLSVLRGTRKRLRRDDGRDTLEVS